MMTDPNYPGAPLFGPQGQEAPGAKTNRGYKQCGIMRPKTGTRCTSIIPESASECETCARQAAKEIRQLVRRSLRGNQA